MEAPRAKHCSSTSPTSTLRRAKTSRACNAFSPEDLTSQISMQSSRLIPRASCCARNAYNPILALHSTFSTTTLRRETDELSQAARDVVKDDKETLRRRPLTIRRVDWKIGAAKSKSKDKNAGRGTSAEQNVDNHNEEELVLDHHGNPALRWRQRIRSIRGRLQNRRDKDQETVEEKAKIIRVGDYHPSVLFTIAPDGNSSTATYPWAIPDNEETRHWNGIQLLDEEIRRFGQWIQPTTAEHAARKAAIDDIVGMVKTEQDFKSHPLELELFGSSLNGVALPLSDIDLRIHNREKPDTPPRFMITHLRRLKHHLREDPRFENVELRGEAYPMLAFRHVATGINVQIVSNLAGQPQVEVVKRFTQDIPNMKELFWLFRVALDMRGLVEVFHGGIGSYGLFVMLAAVLNRGAIKHASLAEQLQHLLHFYAVDINTTKRGISTSPTRPFFLKHSDIPYLDLQVYADSARRRGDPIRAGQWRICQTHDILPYLLCLQDPANPLNDLGKKTYAIKHILQTFRNLSPMIKQIVRLRDVAIERTWDGHGKSTLGRVMLRNVVGDCAGMYRERRERLESVGREVLLGKSLEAIMRERGEWVEKKIRFTSAEERREESNFW